MKVNRIALLLTASILLTCVMNIPVTSQQKKKQDEDVIKITTELVQIDVLVMDKNNRPVAGLKREDFELYDNDKPQVITHFSYEENKAREDSDLSRSLPRGIEAKDVNRTMAFVIDTIHMKPENLYRTRRMLEDFVSTKMAPGDLVLVLPTGGGSGLYQQFTSDRRVLIGAINRLRPAFILDNDTPARRGSTSQQVLELLPALAEGRSNVPQAEGQGGAGSTRVNVAGLLEEADVRTTLNSLNSLIDAMGKLPGRKVSLFVSEGFGVLKNNMSSELTEITSRAARANVVFYSIDPAGLDPISSTATTMSGTDISKAPAEVDMSPSSVTGIATSSHRMDINSTNAAKRRDYFESQDALNALAVDTGGKFFRNTNDIKAGLASVLEENSAYYLLGFQPEKENWDGKFHKVKVVVRGRPDFIVSTRKGYLARADKPKERGGVLTAKAAEAIEAINSPLTRRDIDLQLTAFYRDDTKLQPVLTSMLHIDTSKLNFKQDGGKHRAKIEIIGFVLDATGRAADSFSRTADLSLDPQIYQALTKDGLLTIRSSAMKPGAYQIKVLVREPESGFIGTASTYVEIPDIKSDRLALSSIFTDVQLFKQDKQEDVTGIGGTLSKRRFQRNGEFAYVTILYNAKTDKGNKPQLEMQTRILKGNQVVYNGKLKPVEMLEGSTPPSRIITGGIMRLAGIVPGDYTLEVTVVDKLAKKEAALARQEIDFSVE